MKVAQGGRQREMVRAMPHAPPGSPGSLAVALAVVPDPRRPYGWRPEYAPVPLVALLQATVAAMLSGARSQYAVAQWVRERAEDAPALLEALGFPRGRSVCVATLHRVYKALDVAAFEAAVGGVPSGEAPGWHRREWHQTIPWRWMARRCAGSTATWRRGSTSLGCIW